MIVLARWLAVASTPLLVLGAEHEHGWGRFFVGFIIAVVAVAYLRHALAADKERRGL